jgi:hypothetical protein
LSAFKPSSIPSKATIACERQRRANRRRAQWLEELAYPGWTAWTPEADDDPQAWRAAHWSETALEDYEIFTRDGYFRTIDTVMGAIALAVWEAGPSHVEVARLLESVGLPGWPAGAGEQAADRFRRNEWGVWEFVYFKDWLKWAPLGPDERHEAHAKSWRRHLEGEAQQERWLGRCWWRTCCDPNPNVVVARVDIEAGLRLASERGHDEVYPRPEEDEVDEEK